MSYPTRRFKPKISRVRSSHSSVNQPVKIMRCPQMLEANNVVLEDFETKPTHSASYKPRRSSLLKKGPKKMSPPKGKSSKTSVTGSTAANDLKSGQHVLNDDFLEEMKLVGEKLRNIEKELTRKKILGKPPSNPSELNIKPPGVRKETQSPYNPIDFTDMDFDAGARLSTETSFDESGSGEPQKGPSSATGAPLGRPFLPTNEAVESVIAKIRNDIKTWRISKGLEENCCVERLPEPFVTSNGRGEIVVREEAERETPCESNRYLQKANQMLPRSGGSRDQSTTLAAIWRALRDNDRAYRVMRTDPVFNVTFVSIVEKHPCLYASSSPDYNNRSVQEKAWEAVANEVHESVTECKERWKNIRGCYTRYLKSLSTGGGKKQPYYLADSLHFLLQYTKSRSRDYLEFREYQTVEPSVTLEEDDGTSSSQEVGGFEMGSPDVKDPADFAQQVARMSADSEFVAPPAQKRFRLSRDSSSVDEPSKQVMDFYQYNREIQDEKKREDADLAFLTSLLYDMKDMTSLQKRKFKIGILDLVGRVLSEPSSPDAAPRDDADPAATPASSCSSSSAPKVSSNFEKSSEN